MIHINLNKPKFKLRETIGFIMGKWWVCTDRMGVEYNISEPMAIDRRDLDAVHTKETYESIQVAVG